MELKHYGFAMYDIIFFAMNNLETLLKERHANKVYMLTDDPKASERGFRKFVFHD
jgi:hypothetical protein